MRIPKESKGVAGQNPMPKREERRTAHSNWNIRDHFSDLGIEHLTRLLAERFLELFRLPSSPSIAHGPNNVIHPIIGTRFKCQLGDLLQVILSTSRHFSEENLFGNAATKSHAHPVEELRCREEIPFGWEVLAERK